MTSVRRLFVGVLPAARGIPTQVHVLAIHSSSSGEVGRHYQVRNNQLTLEDSFLRPDEMDYRFEERRLDLLCGGLAVDDTLVGMVNSLLGASGPISQDLELRHAPLPQPRPIQRAMFSACVTDPHYQPLRRPQKGIHLLLSMPASPSRPHLIGLPPDLGLRLSQARTRLETTIVGHKIGGFLAEVVLGSEFGELVFIDLLSHDETDLREHSWIERQVLLRQVAAEVRGAKPRAEWPTLVEMPAPRDLRQMQLATVSATYGAAPLVCAP